MYKDYVYKLDIEFDNRQVISDIVLTKEILKNIISVQCAGYGEGIDITNSNTDELLGNINNNRHYVILSAHLVKKELLKKYDWSDEITTIHRLARHYMVSDSIDNAIDSLEKYITKNIGELVPVKEVNKEHFKRF